MLLRPSSRKPHRGYPGSQQALAFVAIPDNAFGVSGMTPLGVTKHPDSV